MQLKTELSDSGTEHQDGEDRTSPYDTDDDRIISNKEHVENHILSKKRETQDKEENRVPPNIKKTLKKQRPSQKTNAELYTFDDTKKLSLFDQRNSKVAVAVGLNASRMRPLNFVFDTGVERNLLCEDIVELYRMSWILVSGKQRLESTSNLILKITGTIMPPYAWEKRTYATSSRLTRD